jgi:hypothetical protein
VACGDPLQGIRDQRPGPTLGLAAGLLLHLPHRAGQLVPDEVLGALEEVLLRLVDGQAGDPLELGERLLLRLLQLLLELLRVNLAIRDTLLAPLELGHLLVGFLLALQQPFLELHNLRSAIADLRLDVAAEPDGILARLDLRLAPHRLGLSLGVAEQLRARALRVPQAGARAGP